jgi:hypothetical protein
MLARATPDDGSTRRIEVQDLGQPDAVVSSPLGKNQQVRLASTVVSRIVLRPGCDWQQHAEPIQSGDVVLAGDRVRGVAVHVAARIVTRACPGELLVSRVTHDLADGGQGLTFEARGSHRLKGVEQEHEAFVVPNADEAP